VAFINSIIQGPFRMTAPTQSQTPAREVQGSSAKGQFPGRAEQFFRLDRRRHRLAAATLIVIACFLGGAVLAGADEQGLRLGTGREIFRAACVSCHGADGSGQSQNLAGFERPATFPDFVDCATSTPEPDVQWRAIISNGGPARGFSEIMPSFKDALTQEQIGKVIAYLRSLCTDESWPRGNFNLPRPLIAEKAFPENEAVVSGAFNVDGGPEGGVSAIYERRTGSSGMIETKIPYNYSQASGSTRSGFGDVAIGYKHKLFASLDKGAILSAGGEWSIPTGNADIGTGGESSALEAFAAYGQFLPADSFLQVHTGIELPMHPDEVPRAFFVRTVIGKTFSSAGGLGRRWSPMVEVIADRDFLTGARTNWDLVPEIQIPINKRMHILANIGYRVPVNDRADRPSQLLFYLLWDYVDGGLVEGWR
jgi:mono/diheme cytochrome c family protein